MTWGQRTNAVVFQASILDFIYLLLWRGEWVVLREIWVVWRAWQAEKCPERSSRVGKTAGLVCILAFSAPSPPVKENNNFFFCPHRGPQLFLLPRPGARADLSEVYQTRPGNLYPPPAPREFRDPGGPPSRRSEEQGWDTETANQTSRIPGCEAVSLTKASFHPELRQGTVANKHVSEDKWQEL